MLLLFFMLQQRRQANCFHHAVQHSQRGPRARFGVARTRRRAARTLHQAGSQAPYEGADWRWFASLPFRDLKKTIAFDSYVFGGVRMNRRASGGHENPILGLVVCWETSARSGGQAQGWVSLAAVYRVGDLDR